MMENIKNRKQQHLDICLNRNLSIESPDSYLSHIKLPHKAMPEINSKDVSLRTPFLSYALKSPLMISCMTGGSSEGYILNRILAEAANKHGLAIGTGSIRVLMAHPETRSHFELKKIATDVPVLANIGAAQLNVYPVKNVIETVKIINADGLYIHLNSAQELFQDGGDQVFSGWYDSIARLMEQADFPVLIKETGAGIP
ncbi:MAG: type 2 isopentenyl-diphosphate Delta-isomerase, partial [Spirochaetaceae bacterium]|nr:type 2 isopentenyl-diphosphate Delta-isomerase [Spirochaetaceae bacterium]